MRFDLPALMLFALAAGITPGPNNIMAAASAMRFGMRATTPQLGGILAGLVALMAGIVLTVETIRDRLPAILPILRIIGTAYLLYLAYRIAVGGDSDKSGPERPLQWQEAAAFQLVNPKAWMTSLAVVTTYGATREAVAPVSVIYLIVNGACICAWAATGALLRARFEASDGGRGLRFVLAGLLAASIGLLYA